MTKIRDETATGELINEYAYEYDGQGNPYKVSMTYDGDNRTEYTTDRESAYSQTLVKREYEKNVFGAYTEPLSSTTYTYGLGLTRERRDTGEEYYYHYNHLGSTMAVSGGSGEIIYRFVYGTYGELYDVKDGNGESLGNIAASEGYTYGELAHALGMEYLYNGQYGVSTDKNGLYYMRARYYDQSIKRFINRDILSGEMGNSRSLNRYSYVQGNPVSLTDPFGLCPDGNGKIDNLVTQMFGSANGMLSVLTEKPTVSWKDVGKAALGLFWIGGDPATSLQQLCVYAAAAELDWSAIGHTLLGLTGIVFDAADLVNAAWYFYEENYEMAAVSMLCALPYVGTLAGGSAGLALKVIGKGFTLGFAAEGTFESISRAVNAYEEGTLSWWNALDVGVNVLGLGLSTKEFKGTFGDVLAGRTEPGILNRITPMNDGGYLNLDAFIYRPTSKHDPVSGWGSKNPIPDAETGQVLLDTAYSTSKNKQLYNIYNGELIKFQPDTVEGWHAYLVTNTSEEVPTEVLRKMLDNGIITRAQYKKFVKNK